MRKRRERESAVKGKEEKREERGEKEWRDSGIHCQWG